MKRTLTLGLMALAYSSAFAGIASFGGQADMLVAGPAVGYKANFFNDGPGAKAHGWNERQGVTLTNNLVVDISAPGAYNGNANANAIIPAGTVVNSHYIYFDPIQNQGVGASFTFDAPILGIIIRENTNAATDHLLASDFLIPGVVPAGNLAPGWFNARGMEPTDLINWVGANTIRIDWDASNPGDQIRVITGVPEPATMTALSLAGAFLLRRRKR